MNRVEMGHYTAKTRSTITQDQCVAWLRELLTGTSESLPCRVASILLLLHETPFLRVAKLRTDAVETNEANGIFGAHPLPVPEPLAELLREHLVSRPNLRTAAGTQSP